jgi:hypothetical protein
VGGPSKLEMALALGHLLGRAGMPHYAAICGSQETADVLAAWERGDRDGFAALERAMDRSGVEPPDLPDFEWGDVMDELEASTRELVSERLELAIAAGELRPGAPGWRARQREIASQLLLASRADLLDQSPLAAIRAQRARTWARQRSGAPRELLEPLLSELFDGPDIAAVRPLPALAWLLARSLEGLPLTAAGFLRPALVREAVERFGLESYAEDSHAWASPPDGHRGAGRGTQRDDVAGVPAPGLCATGYAGCGVPVRSPAARVWTSNSVRSILSSDRPVAS